uniref:Ig-like domain-containing protein n=1 Tax=Poecilia latipinna TaxID=48699 RepID=A0A3B3UGT7_9TELE
IYFFLLFQTRIGSTVILPCYFTPLKSFSHGGREIPLRIVRVLWCKNHQICHKTTPSVYDSNSTAREPRFHYLGNMEANCTLQIRDIRMEDKGTFRFRMEADNSAGHFTNQAGVRISVMKLKSSSKRSEVSRGQTVSLQCTTSTCTFTHLEVTWRKDGHALPGNGSALQLGPLTAKDSGNYSCALRGNMETQSEPFSLQVEEKEEEEEEGWFHIIEFNSNTAGVDRSNLTDYLVYYLGAGNQSVMVKREPSHKVKLSIYWSLFVPTLIHSHELWVMT